MEVISIRDLLFGIQVFEFIPIKFLIDLGFQLHLLKEPRFFRWGTNGALGQ